MKTILAKQGRNRRSGQVMLEFVVAAGVMLVVVVVLTLFMYVFKEYGARVMDLVASEYP